MTIVHMVLYQFKGTVELEDIRQACRWTLELKNQCLHPEHKRPYLKSIRGGRNVGRETDRAVYTHGFIFEFDNEEDLRYYVHGDPVRKAFLQRVAKFTENVEVLDFVPDVF